MKTIALEVTKDKLHSDFRAVLAECERQLASIADTGGNFYTVLAETGRLLASVANPRNTRK